MALCSSSIADEMTRPNEMPVTPCSTIRIMTSTKEPSLGIYKRERQREGAEEGERITDKAIISDKAAVDLKAE